MAANRRKMRKRNRRIRRRSLRNFCLSVLALIAIVIVILAVTKRLDKADASVQSVSDTSQESTQGAVGFTGEKTADRPDLDVELLTVNSYSRPGIALEQVNGIVIHYTANPGSTAMENRDYFEGLKDTHTTSASSHFIVGLDGEIVQCIPTTEESYASNDRNADTISIECCYVNEDGSFNQETYNSVIWLTAWLCNKFHLTSDDVIRHYDVTGKLCPLYYVEHEDAWEQFRADVADFMTVYQ